LGRTAGLRFVSSSVSVAFGALTLALILLWAPRAMRPAYAGVGWIVPFAVALAAALSGGLIDARGLAVLLVLAASCRVARHATGRALRIAAHVVMLATAAGLLLHLLPGFDNPRVLSAIVLSPGSEPYTKYLNFDKGAAGLLLLGAYARLPARDDGHRHVAGFLWRFALMAVAVMAMSLAFGYVRWDPKLAPWWPMWLWSMAFLTALPEEAIFRGVVQTGIARWLGATPRAEATAIVTAGALFGLAHIAGGPLYVVVAAVAGMGYGWIFASARSIAAAILAHTALNTIHFLLFTYPALRSG
jgi:membrane protease YdiL (CAAX protease family)